MKKKINLTFSTFRESDKCSPARGGYGLYFNAVLSGFYLEKILPTAGNWLTVSHSVCIGNFKIFLPFMCILVEVGRGPIRDYQPDLILQLIFASLILCDRYNCFPSIVSVLKCPVDHEELKKKGTGL